MAERLDIRLQKLVDADPNHLREAIEHSAHSDDMDDSDVGVAQRELKNLISTALMLQYDKKNTYDVELIIQLIEQAATKFNIDLDTVVANFKLTKEGLFAEIRKAKRA